MSDGTLRVWIDFLCPWARIGAHWLRNVEAAGALEAEVDWKMFSLEQINLPEDASADELWADAPGRRGLIPAAAAKWVQTQSPESLAAFQKAMFDARHVDHEKIGQPPVTAQVLSSIGLDGETITAELTSDPKWLEAARSDHEEAAALGVFGVPTFVFSHAPPAFVRLLEITEGDRAVEIYERVRAGALDPTIHELKRPALVRH